MWRESLALGLYRLLSWLAVPLVRRRLRRRARAEPLYGEHVEERFGCYASAPRSAAPPGGAPLVWIHAVSLGETRAAAILLRELRARLPGMRLLLTHGTATGRAEGARLLGPGDLQAWLPWDTRTATRRFVRHFRPDIGVLMETEVWPNLAAACRVEAVPLVLANARLNAKSHVGARRLAWLARPAYRGLAAAWAQAPEDARRLREVGAPVAGVLGNLKFDLAPDPQQQALGQAWRRASTRPVVLLASSREGEELLWLQALGALGPAARAVQWLVVPRHPQRFDEVARLCEEAGWSVSRRSAWLSGPPAADIWLGDSLGEMALYYQLADVALLGGSFEPLGGQNLIEAAAGGCPVVMGPHTFNFAEAAALALQAGAAERVADMGQGVGRAIALALDAGGRPARGARCTAFAQAHRGAAAATAEAIAELLRPSFHPPADHAPK